MLYKTLGKTTMQVSELCLGTMQFGWSVNQKGSFNIISEAIENGINFIDTANIYSQWVENNASGTSESIIGNWISQTNIPRDQYFIATKVRGQIEQDPNNQGLGKHHIMKAVEDSLKRLKIETIDLYQAHWPDQNTDIEETLTAMDDLIKQGKVRYIGCSNYSNNQLIDALLTSKTNNLARFQSIQPHYSLINRSEFEKHLQQTCEQYQLGVTPYSPLGAGFLTGKYHSNKPIPKSVRASKTRKYITKNNLEIINTLSTIALDHNKTVSQIALSWLLSKQLVTSPIIGPRTINQLRDNVGSIHVKLTSPEIQQIDQVSKNN